MLNIMQNEKIYFIQDVNTVNWNNAHNNVHFGGWQGIGMITWVEPPGQVSKFYFWSWLVTLGACFILLHYIFKKNYIFIIIKLSIWFV